MSTSRARRSATTALALAALALGLTGCGTASSGGTATPVAAQRLAQDDALRDLLPEHVRRSGVLTLGTDASYAPANGFGEDGRTVVGFEPDLAAAVGEVLGVEVHMQVRPFDGLLDDVRAHRVDLGMAAITDTREREGKVDFVTYFSAGSSIVVRKGNPQGILDLGDLCGQTVAVERATVQVDLLERAQQRCDGEAIQVSEHSDNAEALLQLRTGRAVAVLNDYPPAVALATGARTRAYYQLAADTQYEPGLYGVAVAKDRQPLRDAVHGALERVLASGRYAEVLARWNVSGGAVASPTVNSASSP